MPQERADVGVLFVHGIGEQVEGQTLARFGDPILRLVLAWAAQSAEVNAGFTDGSTSSASNSNPAAATLTLTQANKSAQVVFAESWWATSFAPGGYAKTAFWGIRFVWRVVERLRGRTRAVTARTLAEVTNAFDSLMNIGLLLVGTGLSLGGLLIVFGALVLGVELLLLASVVLAILGLLALFILRLVPRSNGAAARLQLRIANSLGDAQVFLNSPTTAQAMVAQVGADLEWLQSRCDRLVVVAHSQGSVVAHAALTRRHQPPWRLTAFCTAGSALSIFNAPDIADVKVPDDEEHFYPAKRAGDRLLRENLRSQAYWTAAAQRFRTLHPSARWLNFWSRCDPVSTGPFSVRPVAGIEEFQIQNTGSFLRDHTAYPNNHPQFVAPLAELILAAAGISAESNLGVPPDRLSDARRAQENLFALRSRARIVSWVAILVVAVWLICAHAGKTVVAWGSGQAERFGPRLPGWIGHIHLSHIVVATALAAITVGTVQALYSGAGALGQRRLNAYVTARDTTSTRTWTVLPYTFNGVLLAFCLVPPAVYAIRAATHIGVIGFLFAVIPVTALGLSAFTLDNPEAYDDTSLEKVCRSLRTPSTFRIGWPSLSAPDPPPETE